MALKFDLLWSILVMFSLVLPSMGNTMSLDEYCYTQLPRSNRKPQAMFSYVRYVRICSNIEPYSECILSSRDSVKTGVTVEAFEKNFPSSYNIFKAGYLFCAEELLERYDRYKFENEDLLRCQHSVDHASCSSKNKLTATAPSSQNSSDYEIAACNASIGYYKCLRDKYVECSSEYAHLFTYQMSRLGRKCLETHKVYNQLLFGIRCLASSDATSLRSTLWWTVTSGLASGLVMCVLVPFVQLSFDDLKR